METELPGNLFEDCDSTYVFAEVRRRLDSGEKRSLWRRIESEMEQGGVASAVNYLEASFKELTQSVTENVSRFRESLED